jgi:hypothetical protein
MCTVCGQNAVSFNVIEEEGTCNKYRAKRIKAQWQLYLPFV